MEFDFPDENNINIIIIATKYNSISLFEWVISTFNLKNCSSILVETTLKMSRGSSIPSSPIVNAAANHGNLELIKHLKETGYILNSTTS